MKKTLADKVIDFLIEKGMKEVPSKSRKYRTFSPPNRDDFYFVGKKGAVRVGKTSSKSFSISDKIHSLIK